MKVVLINSVPYGSTNRIVYEISKLADLKGYEVLAFTGYSSHPIHEVVNSPKYIIGSKLNKFIDLILSKTTGLTGCFSLFSTLALLSKIRKMNPDIIHLHNLHGYYINLPLLFKFIKKHNIKTFWTLHDCWSFTGHCPHFDMIGCDKWKTGCYKCPQYKDYPQSMVDNSKYMYNLKKKWFVGVKDLTIITPSQWLADLVKESFLKDYSVKVINNGIDLDVFKPFESDFRKKYNCEDKFILLGVAFGWGERKGLDVFIELSKRLDERFQIVLVGTDDNVDKQLPQNIISIHRTQNQQELAEIYTAADLFVNPTREDTYPTVNMESIACGTPVLTFNTGGSPEIVDETCGLVVEKNDIDDMLEKINNLVDQERFATEVCVKYAENFDSNKKYEEYINLYLGVL